MSLTTRGMADWVSSSFDLVMTYSHSHVHESDYRTDLSERTRMLVATRDIRQARQLAWMSADVSYGRDACTLEIVKSSAGRCSTRIEKAITVLPGEWCTLWQRESAHMHFTENVRHEYW